jgi:hypothetical protein
MILRSLSILMEWQPSTNSENPAIPESLEAYEHHQPLGLAGRR